MFAEALGAELAPIKGVVGVAADGDRLALLDANQHATADGAVAASGLDPPLGDTGAGNVTGYRVVLEGVLRLPGVDAQRAPQAGPHQYVPPRVNVSAMFRGTTETKKRYRASSTATKAAAQATAKFPVTHARGTAAAHARLPMSAALSPGRLSKAAA